MKVKVPLMLLVLVAPATSATWYAHGTFEPDNALDSTSFMWPGPPGNEKNRIYFNAFVLQTTGQRSGVNPNVGALETNFETVGSETVQAILGIWIDCNRDGYVGLAETAVREYRNELLTDRTLCQATFGSADWNGQPNYNGWVTEFIPIGPFTGNRDPRMIRDDSARVWGDYGRPDGGLKPSCAPAAFAREGARSTGGILDHVDCYLATATGATTSGAYRKAYAEYSELAQFEPNPAEGLGLEDEGWAGEAHPLERETLGDQHGDRAIVQAQDCDAPALVSTEDTPPGHDLDYWEVRGPSTEIRPEGTLAGTANQLFWSMPGGPYDRPGWAYDRDSSCQYSGDINRDGFYELIEADEYDVSGGVKDGSNFLLRFFAQPRGSGAAAAGGPANQRAGGASDFGIEGLPAPCGGDGSCEPTRWYAPLPRARGPPEIVRADVEVPSADLPSAYWLTFYADVGPAALGLGRLPGAAPGIYGFDACGTQTSGVRNGWACNREAWERGWEYYYAVTSQRWVRIPMPGDSYDLRDVDCYDGGSDALAIGLTPSSLGSHPCPNPR